MTYRGDFLILAAVFAISGMVWSTFYLAALGFLIVGVLAACKGWGRA